MNKITLLSSNDLLDIFSISPGAIAIYTTDELYIEAVTDAMLGFWGRDRSIIGLSLAKAIPELAGQRFLDELRSVMRTGVTITGSAVPAELLIGGQLKTRYYDYEYRALRNTKGEIYALLHTTNEVTETVLGKEATEAAAFRLGAMVMNTPIAMTILRGHDLVVEVANQPMLAVWRRTLDQVIGRGLVEIFPELEGQPNPGRMRGVMQSGQRFTLPETEVILGTVEGELKKHYARFSYDPIVERDGTVQSILVTVINITDEVTNRQQLLKATEDLAELNLRLNMAMQASSLGMAEAVFSTGEMICSEQFKSNYGRNVEEEFTYPQLFEAMLPEYREEIRLKVKAAIDSHSIYEAEYEIEWPDGTRHWISAHGIPRYENGVADRIVGVSRLITQQKNVEQQKDDFLSVASHELKTPITALKANLQLLQRLKEDTANPILPKLIDSANKGIGKINILVDDLLNINRFSQSKLELALQEFNVYEMLQSASSPISAENKYEVVIEGEPGLTMLADEHRIEQVVINFINNAIKYAPDSRAILVQYKKIVDAVRIAVTDRGPGIPAEQLPHLFDRYWRANNRSKKYSGLGLGLFICAEIIERHSGSIGADSILGKGSTFWFTVPV